MIRGFISYLTFLVAEVTEKLKPAQVNSSRILKGESVCFFFIWKKRDRQTDRDGFFINARNHLSAIARSKLKFSNVYDRVPFVKSILRQVTPKVSENQWERWVGVK